jgi:hypothetical protein
MEPQWQPPHEPWPPYPPPPPGAAPGPPAYGLPAYGPSAYGPPGYGWAPLPQASQWGPPTGPQAVWAILLWCLAAISLVGVLVCGGIATAGFWSNSYLDSYGVTTTATVTDVQIFTDAVTVEFTTEDGAPARAEIIWFASRVPAVGDEIEITYDPYDPSYATEAGSDSDTVLGVVYVVAGAFALALMVGAIIGAILVHRRRGKAKRESAMWSGPAR